MTDTDRIVRQPEVRSRTGKSRSMLYLDMSRGLFPRPIPLGIRAVGWLASEIDAMISARVRGASDEEIRQLVIRLETARRTAA